MLDSYRERYLALFCRAAEIFIRVTQGIIGTPTFTSALAASAVHDHERFVGPFLSAAFVEDWVPAEFSLAEPLAFAGGFFEVP